VVKYHRLQRVKSNRTASNSSTASCIQQGNTRAIRLMAPGNPSQNASQPQPELNFVDDLDREVSHQAHS
jgi:hypothetical protein